MGRWLNVLNSERAPEEKGNCVGCSPFSSSITSGKLEQGMDEPGGDIKA